MTTAMSQGLSTSANFLRNVCDEASFLRFADALKAETNSPEFKNQDTCDFLRGCAAWSEETNFGRVSLNSRDKTNDWQLVARFLNAGKSYVSQPVRKHATEGSNWIQKFISVFKNDELKNDFEDLASVQDEKSFVLFARSIASKTKYESFENPDTWMFLDACMAWSGSTDFGRDRMGCGDDKNIWQLAARFLQAGEFYE